MNWIVIGLPARITGRTAPGRGWRMRLGGRRGRKAFSTARKPRSGESLQLFRLCLTQSAGAVIYIAQDAKCALGYQSPLRDMPWHRRFIAFATAALLFQSILIGSGLACDTHAPAVGRASPSHAMASMSRAAAPSRSPSPLVVSVTSSSDGCAMAGMNDCGSSQLPSGRCSSMTTCSATTALCVSAPAMAERATPPAPIVASFDAPTGTSVRPELPPPRA